MKHGKTFRKLGRDSAHRWAMMRTMVTQLIEHERIKTTVAKAKELRKVADRVVTYAKRGTLSARRRATAVVRTDAAVQKLFTELAARYQGRAGGSRASCRRAKENPTRRRWPSSSTSTARASCDRRDPPPGSD
jgi:large subunit ribosomal protein L17